MECDFALFLGDVPLDELDEYATTYDAISEAWREREADGLAALHASLALCFREERCCREAGLEGGCRAVAADLGGDSDDVLELALGLISKQAEDAVDDDFVRDLLAAVGSQVYRELAFRRAAAVVEKSDSVPTMVKN